MITWTDKAFSAYAVGHNQLVQLLANDEEMGWCPTCNSVVEVEGKLDARGIVDRCTVCHCEIDNPSHPPSRQAIEARREEIRMESLRRFWSTQPA